MNHKMQGLKDQTRPKLFVVFYQAFIHYQALVNLQHVRDDDIHKRGPEIVSNLSKSAGNILADNKVFSADLRSGKFQYLARRRFTEKWYLICGNMWDDDIYKRGPAGYNLFTKGRIFATTLTEKHYVQVCFIPDNASICLIAI
jgi:hypothetical protein